MIPPNKEGGPAAASRATVTNSQHSRLHRRQDGYAAPGATDRADAEFEAEAKRRGYRLSVQCLDCHRPLTDPVSVAYHRGPTCRARAGVA